MRFLNFFLILFLFNQPNFAKANSLISGISNNEINIDTDFKGAQILLFGAKNDVGNIVVAVRGPQKNFIVSKKEKLFGIWYNGQRVIFKESFGFYSLFSTFNRGEMLASDLVDYELGRNNIKFKTTENIPVDQLKEFRVQLIELLEKKKYYRADVKKIDFLDETLFKLTIDFPKNIILGTYIVEIYLINNGTVLSYQAIPIYVNQVGVNATIANFAANQKVLYGIVAVFLAVIVGFITNYFFIKFIKK